MKQLFIIIIVLFSFNYSAFAQNGFELIISTLKHEKLFEAQEDNFGYYTMVGFKTDVIALKQNAYLIQVSPFGEITFEYEYDLLDSNSLFANIHYLNDNYIIIGGKGAQSEEIKNQLWIKVLDMNLSEIVDITYDLQEYYLVDYHSILNNDGNIVFCGVVFHPLFDTDIMLFEFTPEGDSVNSKIYNLEDFQFAYDLIENNNLSGYKLITRGVYANMPQWPGYLFETDSLFQNINLDTIPRKIYDQNSAKRLSNFSYLLTGKKWFHEPSHVQMGIIKLNAGEVVLAENYFGMGGDTNNYPGSHSNLDFISTDNIYFGGIANVVPVQMPWQQENSWILLNNLDSSLNLKWQKYYGGDAFYYLWGLTATQDGGCIMLCTKYDHLVQYHEYDILILKVDSNGLITSFGETPAISIEDIIVFPNPGRELINVRGLNLSGTFILYNITGAIIRSTKVSNTNPTISVKDIPAGIYFYRIVDNDVAIKSGKWVKR